MLRGVLGFVVVSALAFNTSAEEAKPPRTPTPPSVPQPFDLERRPPLAEPRGVRARPRLPALTPAPWPYRGICERRCMRPDLWLDVELPNSVLLGG